MADDIIPYDVRQFILRYIDSIAQLEGLLLFHNNPDKKWSAEAIAQGLYINGSQAITLLTRLLEQGFIIMIEDGRSQSYQYQSKSPELANMTDCIAELYRQYLVPVTNLIHAKAKSRIQEFADAFRIRKD
jgi:predicted transcriptional regulator